MIYLYENNVSALSKDAYIVYYLLFVNYKLISYYETIYGSASTSSIVNPRASVMKLDENVLQSVIEDVCLDLKA